MYESIKISPILVTCSDAHRDGRVLVIAILIFHVIQSETQDSI
jgi:hypothetical protein